jgi:hypothetical protein
MTKDDILQQLKKLEARIKKLEKKDILIPAKGRYYPGPFQ